MSFSEKFFFKNLKIIYEKFGPTHQVRKAGTSWAQSSVKFRVFMGEKVMATAETYFDINCAKYVLSFTL